MLDTPTLSPADRTRLDAALDALEGPAPQKCEAMVLTYVPAGRPLPRDARAALTATVAALVAEAEARGREAGAKVCESRAASHRGDGHRGWAGEAEDCALAIRSATPAPTPHAAWCQSRRYHAPAAPLPCNCAGHRDQGEGEEVL